MTFVLTMPVPSRPGSRSSRSGRLPWLVLVLVLLLVFSNTHCHDGPSLFVAARANSASSSSSTATTTSSIPRSLPSTKTWQLNDDNDNDDNDNNGDENHASISFLIPPWNPSPQIDDKTGYLQQNYQRIPGTWEDEFPMAGRHCKARLLESPLARVCQVPGDGNCLFHSLSLSLRHVQDKKKKKKKSPTAPDTFNTHDWPVLAQSSRSLRQQAVDFLRDKPRRLLYLQGNDCLRAHSLVEAAASQYGVTGDEYCVAMRQEGYWGGGPEIVALCNLLKRPIHVYELASVEVQQKKKKKNTTGKKQQEEFCLRRMACFGSPRYDRREALHILSADSRFPDVLPGRQLESGNHFLAIFPIEVSAKRKVRGGDATIKGNTKDNVRTNDSAMVSTVGRGLRGVFGRIMSSTSSTTTSGENDAVHDNDDDDDDMSADVGSLQSRVVQFLNDLFLNSEQEDDDDDRD